MIYKINNLFRAGILSLVAWGAAMSASAQTNFATLVSDGGWCWFADPRAVFHNGTLYFGYVRGSDGYTALNTFNLQTGTTTNLWLSTLTAIDDHNVPGIQVREDGTLLVLWARHGSDNFFSYRQSTSTNPVRAADWGPEQQTATVSGLTYCNPFQLTNESGKIYEFSRDLNYNPTVFSSTDKGNTWSAPQLMIKTGTGGTRPYVKYCSDYNSRIDVLYTDAHPDNYTCSLYHLFYQGGAFYQTDGTFMTNYASLPIQHDAGQRGSVVYQYNAAASSDPNQWIATARAWCWEIAYQTNGAPVCVFQTKVDAVTGSAWSDARIYYYYARWTGTNWQKRFIAQGGRPLYNGQPDYGGGIALDPKDVNTVYFSSDAANPLDLTTTTSVPLGNHYEIWKGVTADGGLTFTWQAVTKNSSVDNCRPYIPRRFGGEPCVLWWRGDYTSYLSFSSAIVGLFTTAVPTVVVTNPPVIPAPSLPKANNVDNLNTAGSWVGQVVPAAGQVALWDSTVTAANAVVLGADLNWSGIGVTNPGGDVSITGGNTLTLGVSGIDMSAAAVNLTLSSGLTLGAGNQTWNVSAGRMLALNTGTFTRTSAATLNVQGAGTVVSGLAGLANDSSAAGGILGPWATTGTGSGTAYAALSAGSSGSVTSYAGGIAGTFSIPASVSASSNYVITTAGSIAFGAATRTVNTIRNTAGACTLTWGNSASQINLVANGILNAGTGLLTIAQGGSSSLSGLMIGGNNNRELVLNAANASLLISGRIINNSGGDSSVTVAAAGENSVKLAGNNTYTGGTTLNAGTLTLGNVSGLGSSTGALAVNGGVLELGGLTTTVGAVVINGGTIQNGTLTATSYAVTNAGPATVTANLAGGSAALNKNGSGTLTLSGANTYAGGTRVLAGRLNCNGSLGAGPVTVVGGTLGGTGTIGGAVTVQAGGTLAPGADAGSIGSLTITSALVLQPGSETVVKIGKTDDGIVSDLVTGLTSLACAGKITVTNVETTAFVAGDTFKIFSSASYAGAFTTVSLPVLARGLVWTNGLAVDGTLAVQSRISVVPTNLVWSVSGTNLMLAWPDDHLGWRLLMQTNELWAGLGTNWQTVSNSTNFNECAIPIDRNHGAVFFRLAYP